MGGLGGEKANLFLPLLLERKIEIRGASSRGTNDG
jgi:hypothetical protein